MLDGVAPIEIPPALAWDHRDPPADELWRLQRIAEWFPHFGRDRHVVMRLRARLDELDVPLETRRLIELYAEEWERRGRRTAG